MTNSTFSQWLLSELETRKWSQVDLSRRSGVSQSQITRVLSGERGVGEKALRAIADALKLPPEKVFREAGLLPKKDEINEQAEEINHKINLLTPQRLAAIEVIIDAFLREDNPPVAATKQGKVKGSA